MHFGEEILIYGCHPQELLVLEYYKPQRIHTILGTITRQPGRTITQHNVKSPKIKSAHLMIVLRLQQLQESSTLRREAPVHPLH